MSDVRHDGVWHVVANRRSSVAVRRAVGDGDGDGDGDGQSGRAGEDGPGGRTERSGPVEPAAIASRAVPGAVSGAVSAAALGAVSAAVPMRSLPLLVAGDRVRCEGEAGGTLRVVELLPRSGVLARPDHRGQPKPLAANLTCLAIVSATPPGIDTLLIDEFCVGAWRAGIEALVVVNKADLLEGAARAEVLATLEVYRRVGHPTVLVDAKSEAGVRPLEAELVGRTAALVGASGVGKSSIVQRLLPDLEVRIGAISAATGLGAHTTSVTYRYTLPGGGAVIDSPGVRRYSVAHADAADVRAGYREIARAAPRCRYRDCAHVVEPGCAVRDALEAGEIAAWRYANYRKLAGV